MELSWMKHHRTLIGKLTRFANIYASMYATPIELGLGCRLSIVQLQTLEYALENEDCYMSELAQKLGLPRATFSKNVKVLEQHGLVRRYRRKDNRKNIYLFATDAGKKLYENYAERAASAWFPPLFKLADTVPPAEMRKFEALLDADTELLICAGRLKDELPVYEPVTD